MTIRVRVVVEGRVQGVFFRASCAERARRLGVGGWVRNLADGRVEAAFEGDPDAVRQMVGWCREGPAGARVTGLETVEEPPVGSTSFAVAG